jgi:hypothetical protein
MHQMVANVLRTTLLPLAPPQNVEQDTQLIENALATTAYATRASVSRSLGVSPGNMVFGRDMFLDLPVLSDLLTFRDKRQELIDANLRQQNAKRREYRYTIGQEV